MNVCTAEEQNCAVTYKTGISERGCSIGVAVRKEKDFTLPRVSATDANVVRIAIGDLPTSRHVQRLTAICSHLAIINSAPMQRHVEIVAIALEKACYRV